MKPEIINTDEVKIFIKMAVTNLIAIILTIILVFSATVAEVVQMLEAFCTMVLVIIVIILNEAIIQNYKKKNFKNPFLNGGVVCIFSIVVGIVSSFLSFYFDENLGVLAASISLLWILLQMLTLEYVMFEPSLNEIKKTECIRYQKNDYIREDVSRPFKKSQVLICKENKESKNLIILIIMYIVFTFFICYLSAVHNIKSLFDIFMLLVFIVLVYKLSKKTSVEVRNTKSFIVASFIFMFVPIKLMFLSTYFISYTFSYRVLNAPKGSVEHFRLMEVVLGTIIFITIIILNRKKYKQVNAQDLIYVCETNFDETLHAEITRHLSVNYKPGLYLKKAFNLNKALVTLENGKIMDYKDEYKNFELISTVVEYKGDSSIYTDIYKSLNISHARRISNNMQILTLRGRALKYTVLFILSIFLIIFSISGISLNNIFLQSGNLFYFWSVTLFYLIMTALICSLFVVLFLSDFYEKNYIAESELLYKEKLENLQLSGRLFSGDISNLSNDKKLAEIVKELDIKFIKHIN